LCSLIGSNSTACRDVESLPAREENAFTLGAYVDAMAVAVHERVPLLSYNRPETRTLIEKAMENVDRTIPTRCLSAKQLVELERVSLKIHEALNITSPISFEGMDQKACSIDADAMLDDPWWSTRIGRFLNISEWEN